MLGSKVLQFLNQSYKSQFNHIVLLIPAYNPPSTLVSFIIDLVKSGFDNIIVVDDGSRDKELFNTLGKIPSLTLLCHNTNLGKGAALKTGFKFILEKLPEIDTILTCDSDGQHSVADILYVAHTATQNKDMFILGVRGFKEDIPLRSKLGNLVIKWLLRNLAGLNLKDCQTGLRAFPKAIIIKALALKSNGYEFELGYLLLAHSLGFSFFQVPIKTIYYDDNKGSHFKPIKDSFKVLFTLLLSWIQNFTLCASSRKCKGKICSKISQKKPKSN